MDAERPCERKKEKSGQIVKVKVRNTTLFQSHKWGDLVVGRGED